MAGKRTVRRPLDATRLVTGFTALKAVIQLQVRDQRRRFQPIDFLVDSGTNITTLSVADAEDALIPFPAQTVVLAVRTAVGEVRQRVHPGYLTVRVPGLAGREFVWPCHFVEQRGVPPTAALGLGGVLNDLRIILDGTYALEARHGWVVLEELTG
jgi:hypothetical protein